MHSWRAFPDAGFFDGCASAPTAFKRLLFSVCFLHAIAQERRAYGPLGWCVPYEFNDSDLRISVLQLRKFIDDAAGGEIPYKALTYLIGECNYGGRVTDENDRRCLTALVKDFVSPRVLDDAFRFGPSGACELLPRTPVCQALLTIFQLTLVRGSDTYATIPAGAALDAVGELVRALPLSTQPEVLGLHDNATISRDGGEAQALLDALLLTQPRVSSNAKGGGGPTPEAIVDALAGDLLSRLPADFDVAGARERYPVTYEESMNTVGVGRCAGGGGGGLWFGGN
jgi:dynein heavy chain